MSSFREPEIREVNIDEIDFSYETVGEEFEKEVYDSIKNLKLPENIEVKRKFEVKGLSKNFWSIDICLKKKTEGFPPLRDSKEFQERILALIECKNVRTPSPSTHRTQYFRAYAELGDLRNFTCPKFLVIPHKLENQRVGSFNYDSFFGTIGTKIIEWEAEDGRNSFLDGLTKLVELSQ